MGNPFRRADHDGAPSIRPKSPKSSERPMRNPVEILEEQPVDRPVAAPGAETPMKPATPPSAEETALVPESVDDETRQEQARLLKYLTVLIHDSGAKCPPMAAMWAAVLIGVTGSRISEADGLRSIATDHPDDLVPAEIKLVWDKAPQWLGLDSESAKAMLRPELEEADWRAKPDEHGYVSIRSIRKMLDAYAETGTIRWPSWDDAAGSWESVCEQNGIQWAAWKTDPISGWREPGTERIAIVKFKDGREPGLGRFEIERQFSELAHCEVSLTSPERIPERQRDAELSKADTFYGRL